MNEHVNPILNDQFYTDEMAKSMWDKAFFVNFVDATLLVDFGCADGAMLGFIARNFSGIKLVGFDNDEKMLDRAKVRNPGNPGNPIIYTSDWAEIAKLVNAHQAKGEKAALSLASVVHEIKMYLKGAAFRKVMAQIWGQDGVAFDFIAFRDMMVSEHASRPAHPNHVARVRQVFGKMANGRQRLSDWEKQWGSISENWSLIHFFLTYRYVDNWDRELRENYLPTPYEDFLADIPNEYFPIYKDHYTLPFLYQEVDNTFGIQLSDPTHLKLVLKLRPDLKK